MLDDLIKNNLDSSIEELSETNPAILNLSFEEIDKKSDLTIAFDRPALDILIQKQNSKNSKNDRFKIVQEQIILHLSLEKTRVINDALAYFKSFNQEIFVSAILNLTPRLIHYGCSVPKPEPEPELSHDKKLLEEILGGIYRKGLEGYLVYYTSPECIKECDNLEVPDKIKKAWDAYLKSRQRFFISLREIGLTDKVAKDWDLNPEEFGFED